VREVEPTDLLIRFGFGAAISLVAALVRAAIGNGIKVTFEP
jgi:hypothetical protein